MIIAKVVFLFRTKCYILVDQKLNFHNAERFCKSEFGGSLASIRNISEFNFIETMLNSYNPEDQAFFIRENRSWNLGIRCQDITQVHYLIPILAGKKLYWATYGSNDPDTSLVLMKNSGWKFDYVSSTTILPFICQTDKDQRVSKSKEPSRKVGVVTSILIEFQQISTL